MVEPLAAANRDAVVAGKPFFPSGLDELFPLPEKAFLENLRKDRVLLYELS